MPGGKTDPERKCIVTGKVQDKTGMIRFVIGPDGTPVPDLEEKLPGRGIWVEADRKTIETALARGHFSKAAKRKIDGPADLADTVEGLLKKRCLNYLGLAFKTGLVVAGYEKVRAGLKAGQGALLVQASDGAADGRGKISGLGPDLDRIELFTSEELGQALGREQAVHVLLNSGSLTERLQKEAGKLSGFICRGDEPPAKQDRK